MKTGFLHPEARIIWNEKSYVPSDFMAQRFEQPWLNHVRETISFWLSDAPVLEQKSSGSTGEPKPILLAREVLAHSAKSTLAFFKLQPKDSALLFLPAQFVGGKMMIIRTLVGGLQLHIVEPKTTLPKLQNSFDFVALTPMQAAQSIDELHRIKTVLLGGAPVSETVSAQLKNVKTAVFHGYGMTETASHIALRKVNGTHFFDEYDAMPGVTFSTDSRGCLVIHAPGWGVTHLVTNDVVTLKTSQKFVWRGRADFVINSGGLKLFPEEIEKQLETQISVPFFISAVPDKILGQKLVLVVESPSEFTIDFSFLPKIQQPKHVFFLPKFSYTASGKVNRVETGRALSVQR